ncbi:MAG TPA: tRNA pseudouridine(55) synthase TruB [Chitinophagaceae bacterium]|nr:tRNA pseudouridine(55) synthase TruB [Chitinophagaceae bacterium]
MTIEQNNPFAEGKMLLLDKSLDWTSFDVVAKIRSLIGIKKIGHAGTLDPLATGLLIICTGKFTKKINEYMAQEKEYTGTFTLGATTPTYDLESEPENFKEYHTLTYERITKTTKNFVGEILQKPPAHSAVKVGGKPLYKSARKGIEVKVEPRKVVVKDFQITKIEMPVVYFTIVCSTGTYIRSIANDFGEVLGCGAYLSSLRRTRIGEFHVKDALTIKEFAEKLHTGFYNHQKA